MQSMMPPRALPSHSAALKVEDSDDCAEVAKMAGTIDTFTMIQKEQVI